MIVPSDWSDVVLLQDSDEDIDALMSAHYKSTRSMSSAHSMVPQTHTYTHTHTHTHTYAQNNAGFVRLR